MSLDVFRSFCEILGYDPTSVLSVRVNPRQVVVVAKNDVGELHVTNYEQADSGRRHVSQGANFVGPRQSA
jgi:hypothetical protein